MSKKEPGKVHTTDISSEYITCVDCGESTGMPTDNIPRQGATQFVCQSCKNVNIYRYGDFDTIKLYEPPPPLKISDQLKNLDLDDF